MDLKALDQDFRTLADKKNKLSGLKYDDAQYETLEDEVHDMEDDFLEKYGDYLEDALYDVHDEFCPDTDVLLPIAYIAKKYIVNEDKKYHAPEAEGVYVDADDFPGKDTRLVLVPAPTRIQLMVGKESAEIVWTAG